MNQLQSYFDCNVTQQAKEIMTKLPKESLDLFNTPISESNYDADFKKFYADKIPNPMSLKQIKRTLDKNGYANLGALFYHFYLIINNSFLFNGKMQKETVVQIATMDLLSVIISSIHQLIPDTRSIVSVSNFDEVFQILETFQASAQIVARDRISVERRLVAVQRIRIKLKEMGDTAAKDAIDSIKQWIGDELDGPLQLSKYGDLVEEIANKLATGNFLIKTQKIK